MQADYEDDGELRIAHLIKPELIAALHKQFPYHRPRASDTERQIFLASGREEVIEFLEQQLAQAAQQALENTHVP